MCSDTLWPYAPLALVTMVPRGSTPGQMYASTPALKVCNHSRRVYWEACETGKLPMTAVARERSSSGTAADQTMSPRCASSPTNSCGTSRAALAKARRSPSLSGRQLTISLCVFSIPMVHQTRRQGGYYRVFPHAEPMPNPPRRTNAEPAPSNPTKPRDNPLRIDRSVRPEPYTHRWFCDSIACSQGSTIAGLSARTGTYAGW